MSREPIRLPDWPRGCSAEMAAAYVGLSTSALHRLHEVGDFPNPVQLTPRRAVWLREDLDIWLDRRAGRLPAVALDGSEWMTA